MYVISDYNPIKKNLQYLSDLFLPIFRSAYHDIR